MPTNNSMQPFANETEVVTFDEMSLENRLDHIAIFGSLKLTKDRQGLAWAKGMRDLFNEMVLTLEADTNLPEKITEEPAESVKNPFG